tara:strand:+ start:327 stop:1220 length:894 start_codon:yes stop_codon:yes gene_type:complete
MNYENEIKNMKQYTYKWNPENYDKPNEPILKVSKSSLGSFDWCPKKYEFNYIQRLPQDTTEAMLKGTVLHNHREDFFNVFDIKKANTMSEHEILEYCTSLMPIDDYYDISLTVAAFEAQRFIDARKENKVHEYLPAVNEGMFDAEITVEANWNEKFPLSRDYIIHIQGIIDRIFVEDNKIILFEYKTGGWKDYKATSMRKEMAFYQLLLESASDVVLEKYGLSRDMEVTHWGWYYPVSNHVQVEPIKKRSMTSVKNNLARLIHAYEQDHFSTKYFYKTCAHCSYFGICDGNMESWIA